MKTQSLSFNAGETKTLIIPARFFRILAAAVGTVDVDFFLNNLSVGEKASGVDAGYYAIPENGFNRIDITSSTTQTVKIAVSQGRGGYDRTVGSVDITNINSDWSNAPKTVTSTSAQLLAANAARRVLIVQNKDAVGTIWLKFGAGAASASNGLKIKPGESLSVIGYAHSGEVNAIGDIASNANVLCVEG